VDRGSDCGRLLVTAVVTRKKKSLCRCKGGTKIPKHALLEAVICFGRAADAAGSQTVVVNFVEKKLGKLQFTGRPGPKGFWMLRARSPCNKNAARHVPHDPYPSSTSIACR